MDIFIIIPGVSVPTFEPIHLHRVFLIVTLTIMMVQVSVTGRPRKTLVYLRGRKNKKPKKMKIIKI
jgi:hypothetical protein